MNSLNTSYEATAFVYPEIAICLDKIDRTKSEVKRFRIPSLTPDMNQEKVSEKIIRQRKDNIENENHNSIIIGNITITNYISILLPKELLAYVGGTYQITRGRLSMGGGLSKISVNNLDAYGTVNPLAGHISVSGTIDSSSTEVRGQLELLPTESERYIYEGSKWIVMFIGGDTNKPRIIAPYEI